MYPEASTLAIMDGPLPLPALHGTPIAATPGILTSHHSSLPCSSLYTPGVGFDAMPTSAVYYRPQHLIAWETTTAPQARSMQPAPTHHRTNHQPHAAPPLELPVLIPMPPQAQGQEEAAGHYASATYCCPDCWRGESEQISEC